MSLQTDLSGTVALVTGGTKGIGRGAVEQLLLAGARVAFCSRDGAEASRLAEELAPLAQDRDGVLGLAADLEDRQSLTALVQAVLARWGRIDTLVCNAGTVGAHRPPLELPPEQFARVMEANVANNFHLAQLVLPQMLARRAGSIVFITSIVAHTVMPTNVAYAAAKAAVTSMARSLAAACADTGVRVNCVAPGLIRTEASRIVWEDPELSESYVEDNIPMRRIGEVEEVGRACVFLASEAASYVTAATIPVDGGRMGIGQIAGSARLVARAGEGNKA